MAKKTFNLTGNGTTAGQALDATATAAKIYGNPGNGRVEVVASDTDGDYVPVRFSIGKDFNGAPGVYALDIPAGWYVALRLRDVVPATNESVDVTLVVE